MSKFFINRPIVAMVISIVMVIVGTVAMVTLPIAQFPEIVPPEIQVRASYPGADARTMEESVATPIESLMSGVDYMNYMYSTNDNYGNTVLTVNFDVGTSPNTDQILTQLRVSQATPQLPAMVNTTGVIVQKSRAAAMMVISFYSPHATYDRNFLTNYAYINYVDVLSRVPGVGRVQVFGGQYAMRIWIKPDQLAKLGVTVPQIVSVLEAQNTVNPSGQVGGEPAPKGQEFTYTVRSQGRLVTAEEFGEIVVRSNPDGSTLRLKDVARIELGAQSYGFDGRFKGVPAAAIGIYQLPGSNAISAAAGVRAVLDELGKRLPKDVECEVGVDTTKAVTAGIHEILLTLVEALLLVILVVYIFLQGWCPTLIPLLAVPVSLIGTFVVFPMLGFSINTLSLFGLVLAIGLVVDDAIVVVEAVEHHIEEGMTPHDATLLAMEQVSGPVIAIALILAAVFIPTAFIPGITGKLYQQFAVTIAISVIFSAFNALTLSPALCALILKPRQRFRGPVGWFFGWFNRGFRRSTDGYIGLSRVLIHKSGFSLIFLALIAVLGVGMGKKLPNSFLPEEDQGYVMATLTLPRGASLQRTSAAARKVEEIAQRIPGVQSVTAIMGFNILSGTQSSYDALFFIRFNDWDERRSPEQHADAIALRLNRDLSQVSEGTCFAFSPPAIPGIGAAGGVNFVLEDRSGTGGDFFADNLDRFVAAAQKRPELARVIATYAAHAPQVYVDVDREKVMHQQVDIAEVYETLETFMGGYLVNYFNRFGRQWQVYLEAEGNYRANASDIGQFYVANPKGDRVPLNTLANIRSITGPEFLMRYNEYTAAQVNATAAPGISSGQAMKAMEEVFAQAMPSEMGFDYMGMSFQEQKAAQGVPASAVFGLSLLFVFLILAALYESWSLPFSVLLGTPIAVAGAFLALMSRHFENDVYAQIGMVMLIGLAAKNAILIVEFAKLEHEKGKNAMEAALAGARLRLRPILMTSFAFILGCVPLWTATGSGAAGRRILGTVVIGGMLAASFIAIFLIPVAYSVVENLSGRFGRHRQPKLEPANNKGGYSA
ncbi:MAG: efflux RND transporter permease subunit [Terriglobia bacterium]